MKQHKNILLVFLLAFSLSCKNCSSKREENNKTPVKLEIVGPRVKALGLAARGKKPEEILSNQGQYWHFKGSIGNLNVTMDLIRTGLPLEGENSEEACGSYYYDNKEEPIGLNCKWGEGKVVEITEQSVDGVTGIFQGQVSGENFSGTWKGVQKIFPFHFKESYPEGVLKLNVFSYRSFTLLFANEPEGPQASITMTLLAPHETVNKEKSDFLRKNFFQYFKEGSAEKSILLEREEFVKKNVSNYFSDYRENYVDEDKKNLKNEDGTFGFGLNYENVSRDMVLYNQNNLLSINSYVYDYSGGAHGNYGSSLSTYDLSTNNALTFQDVFIPGFEENLQKALEKSAKKTLTDENTPLSEILNTETIEVTSNFCLTQKGILFDYTPYEIASFAQGEIRLFVPFNEIKNILKSEFIKKVGL